MSPRIRRQIRTCGTMAFLKTFFIAALFSCLASYSHACAVDGVAAKTDTTITISWDLSGCKRLSAGATFRVCWKNAANSGNACLPPTLEDYGEKGSTTITGLSPSTAYRIRTLWHQRSRWWDVTTRVVSTNPSPTLVSYALRYERETGQKYCVHFFWKTPLVLPSTLPFELKMAVFTRPLGRIGNWSVAKNIVIKMPGPMYGLNFLESTTYDCSFRNNKRYQAELIAYFSTTNRTAVVSNVIEWK
jgi:hypothetical protein